jgi:tRNA pseudouridine55 synthase
MTQGLGHGRVVLVDKPVDWTSYDVVRRAKRGLDSKVGHAGTLDPFATGLLLVLVGQATRISSLLMELPKEYLVRVQFGWRSSTGDPTGELTPVPGRVGRSEVARGLEEFRGRVRQRVPLTSAVKVGGERLYRKAHRGEQMDTPEREVVVYDNAMLEFDESTQQARLLLRTGKGAYVRQIAADLGERLGSAAYASELRRTGSGPFRVEDALSPERLTPELLGAEVGAAGDAVLPLSRALAYLPAHPVDGRREVQAANGHALTGLPEGRVRVCAAGGLLGVWEGAAGVSRPLVVFAEPQD